MTNGLSSLLEIFLYCAAFGVISGIISGLLGIGGGIIIVPFIAWLLTNHGMPAETIMQTAIATSLATIIITSISAVLAQHRRGAVKWPIVKTLTPGIAIGAWFGADLAHFLSSDLLALIFGSFLLLNGLRMAINLKAAPHRQLPGNTSLGIAGAVMGALSTLIGIGGGTLTVPYMTWHNVPIKNAIALGSACGLPIALFGALSFMVIGAQATNLPAYNIGYINIPAFLGISCTSLFAAALGVHLAHKMPTATLKKVFSVILIVVGINMLVN
ncbi:MAG: sulfite exporter TauE/SafE family protein [Cycloclasticus sp.]